MGTDNVIGHGFLFLLVLDSIMGSCIMMNLCVVLIACKFSEEMQMDAEQSVDTVSVIGLLQKLTYWLYESFNKIYRRQQTVHPAPDPDNMTTSNLIQDLLREELK